MQTVLVRVQYLPAPEAGLLELLGLPGGHVASDALDHLLEYRSVLY
jgi:hypothetical protein